MEKYREVAFEIERLWSVRAKVILIVVGAPKVISNRHLSYLSEVGANMSYEAMQKSAILGATHILGKTLQQ